MCDFEETAGSEPEFEVEEHLDDTEDSQLATSIESEAADTWANGDSQNGEMEALDDSAADGASWQDGAQNTESDEWVEDQSQHSQLDVNAEETQDPDKADIERVEAHGADETDIEQEQPQDSDEADVKDARVQDLEEAEVTQAQAQNPDEADVEQEQSQDPDEADLEQAQPQDDTAVHVETSQQVTYEHAEMHVGSDGQNYMLVQHDFGNGEVGFQIPEGYTLVQGSDDGQGTEIHIQYVEQEGKQYTDEQQEYTDEQHEYTEEQNDCEGYDAVEQQCEEGTVVWNGIASEQIDTEQGMQDDEDDEEWLEDGLSEDGSQQQDDIEATLNALERDHSDADKQRRFAPGSVTGDVTNGGRNNSTDDLLKLLGDDSIKSEPDLIPNTTLEHEHGSTESTDWKRNYIEEAQKKLAQRSTLQQLRAHRIKRSTSATVQSTSASPTQTTVSSLIKNKTVNNVQLKTSIPLQINNNAPVISNTSIIMHKKTATPTNIKTSTSGKIKASAPKQNKTSPPVQMSTSTPKANKKYAPIAVKTYIPIQNSTPAFKHNYLPTHIQIKNSIPAQSKVSTSKTTKTAPKQSKTATHIEIKTSASIQNKIPNPKQNKTSTPKLNTTLTAIQNKISTPKENKTHPPVQRQNSAPVETKVKEINGAPVQTKNLTEPAIDATSTNKQLPSTTMEVKVFSSNSGKRTREDDSEETNAKKSCTSGSVDAPPLSNTSKSQQSQEAPASTTKAEDMEFLKFNEDSIDSNDFSDQDSTFLRRSACGDLSSDYEDTDEMLDSMSSSDEERPELDLTLDVRRERAGEFLPLLGRDALKLLQAQRHRLILMSEMLLTERLGVKQQLRASSDEARTLRTRLTELDRRLAQI